MGRTRRAGTTADVRWLDPEEERAWRAVATVMHRLRWALECQLEADAGLSFIEYHALARLSEEPDHTLRMSDLAAVTNASLSRLSHLVTRLEGWGFVRRRPDPCNGRFTQAILTNAGYRKLAASAPAHAAAVRELVVDAFTATELGRLRALSERIVDRIDASQWNQLPT
ncbi:MAG TPA: MarR family transcriptional regulator [Candidatus Dormibacteraeota bacterium]|nr:MarR family transcriptional regulator [Candidatus Dormibacteraeota bacterium]